MIVFQGTSEEVPLVNNHKVILRGQVKKICNDKVSYFVHEKTK